MKKYQYQIVRYIHDLVTGEFVNVGIIVYQKDIKFLEAKFINKYSRLSCFYNDINGHYLVTILRQFETEISKVSSQLSSVNYQSIDEITEEILPKDDSSLICSEVFFGIDTDPKVAIDNLFERLVNKYSG